MKTLLDMANRVITWLEVADNSTTYTATRVKAEIAAKYLWGVSLYPFNTLQWARSTNTRALRYYYPYPEDFETNSIDRLTIDGLPYDKIDYEDLLEVQRSVSSSKRMFADYQRLFFVYPTPSDVLAMDAYGNVQATALSADADTTIFTNGHEATNEAFAEAAFAELIKRKDAGLYRDKMESAKGILAVTFKRLKKNQQRNKPIRPQFNVPDFFKRRGVSSTPGTFDTSHL